MLIYKLYDREAIVNVCGLFCDTTDEICKCIFLYRVSFETTVHQRFDIQ